MYRKLCRSLSAWIMFFLFWREALVHAGVTSSYVRKLSESKDMPIDSLAFRPPSGFNAPQQVHITQGDYDGHAVIISWVSTSQSTLGVLTYSLANDGSESNDVHCNATNYTFASYKSGYIHHCLVGGLMHDSNYTYKLGKGAEARQFWFCTPPKLGPDVAYTFGIIGDLGQTYDSLRTFEHYTASNGQAVLYVGDLSYADHYPQHNGERWDTWGRFIEPSTAYQPWIWTAGNHEIEFSPELDEIEPFKPFLHRYATPYAASNSTSPLWYAIRRASAHIIVLSSYSAYGKYTPQWIWLHDELKRVDRTITPWLIILVHTPLYDSNRAHYMEGEGMRAEFETWFLKYKVDAVFSGHAHAYERTHRVSNVVSYAVSGGCVPAHDRSAPVYVTVGDGGNIEGLARTYIQPQPEYSAFREASYGHAILDIKNRTHAHLMWHRNDDGEVSIADEFWIQNQIWMPRKSSDVVPRRILKKSFSKLKCSVCEQSPLLKRLLNAA
ncbi:hypothetical protein KP509_35G019500 [Ceratopteris richardii]|uniref:Purple acid phosphatase n=1 Tax=Ceratopteris richardii TaxID=49495 RepID=A0A8T2QFL6_CERRI|nr:hypothetical protein KP509_35G019500 [Ceratopteris richardii]